MKTCRKGLHQYDEGKITCPECTKVRKKAWASANSEVRNARSAAWKKSNPGKVKSWSKVYYAGNAEMVKAKTAAWYAANTKKAKASATAWAKANPEKVKMKAAKWYAANIKMISAQKAAWARANPGKVSAKQARRRATKLQATPAWVNKFFVGEIYDLAQRRTRTLGSEWVVDHIIPLRSKKVCGLHWEGNLQVISAKENAAKGNRFSSDTPLSEGRHSA